MRLQCDPRLTAEIDGLSLSAWMSRLVRRHAWESDRPRLTAEQQRRADEQTQPSTSGRQHSTRSNGGGVRQGELWRNPSSVRNRVVLLVSSQNLIDQGITMLYAGCWSVQFAARGALLDALEALHTHRDAVHSTSTYS